MKRIRIIGLALVAAFAMSVVTAAAASAALPEFKSPFPKTFTSTSGTSILTTVGGKTVTCTADTNIGEITGPKTGTVTVTFTGCTSSGVKCNSAGQAAGVIKTKLLKSTLGYINKTEKTVGNLLQPNEGEFFVEFECTGFAKSKVKGGAIGGLTPVNTSTTTFTLTFKQTSGKQAITKLEGGVEEVLESSLNGGAFEKAGEESTDAITLSAASEIIA